MSATNSETTAPMEVEETGPALETKTTGLDDEVPSTTPATEDLQDQDLGGLDEDEDSQMVNLYVGTNEDSDKTNRRFPIRRSAAMLAGFFRTILEEVNDSDEIPVPPSSNLDVAGMEEVLEFIVAYLEYHRDHPVPEDNLTKPAKSNILRENVKCEWDCDFIDNTVIQFENGHSDKGKKRLYDTIQVANFLEIKTLLELGCLCVALTIKGLPVDQVKDAINPDLPMKEFSKASA